MNRIKQWWDTVNPGVKRTFTNPNPLTFPQKEPIRPALDDAGLFDVSAYNPVPGQTDDAPWEASRNFDLKAGTERGGKFMAVPRMPESERSPWYAKMGEQQPMIPFGTNVSMDGENYEVRDMMGAIQNRGGQNVNTVGRNLMDMFIPDETANGVNAARQFGRKMRPITSNEDWYPWN